jgi:hypothetical protein
MIAIDSPRLFATNSRFPSAEMASPPGYDPAGSAIGAVSVRLPSAATS